MSQATAGELATFVVDDRTVSAKVEDASKSESISAKVEQSEHDGYQVGQVYEFDRSLLQRES